MMEYISEQFSIYLEVFRMLLKDSVLIHFFLKSETKMLIKVVDSIDLIKSPKEGYTVFHFFSVRSISVILI